MSKIDEILNTIRAHKESLFSKYSISSMAMFGSYARNTETGQSDLDIVVEFSDKIGIRFIDLADELEKMVGIKIDLVSKKGIKEKYYKNIVQDLIYV